jgi:hypothetical protein
MPRIDRAIMFHVRMAEGERLQLERLAEADGVSASDYVRLSIRRAFIERFGAETMVRSGERRPKR